MLWSVSPYMDALKALQPSHRELDDPKYMGFASRSAMETPLLAPFSENITSIPPPPEKSHPLLDLAKAGQTPPSNGGLGLHMTPKFYPETLGGLVISTSI